MVLLDRLGQEFVLHGQVALDFTLIDLLSGRPGSHSLGRLAEIGAWVLHLLVHLHSRGCCSCGGIWLILLVDRAQAVCLQVGHGLRHRVHGGALGGGLSLLKVHLVPRGAVLVGTVDLGARAVDGCTGGRGQLQLGRRLSMHGQGNATVSRLHQRCVLFQGLQRGVAVDLRIRGCVGIEADQMARVPRYRLLRRPLLQCEHLR